MCGEKVIVECRRGDCLTKHILWLRVAALMAVAWIPAWAQQPKFEAADIHNSTTLRTFALSFGGVVLASATFGPADTFTAACGMEPPPELPPPAAPELPERERLGALNKRETKKLFAQLTSAAALLKVEEAAATNAPETVRAATPWREGAYSVAYDARVDTTFQHRLRHYPMTAATVAAFAERRAGKDKF